MYTFMREITFKTAADAVRGLPTAEAFCQYFAETHGFEMRLLRPVSGSPNRVRFVAQGDSLDAWRAIFAKAMKDPAYHRLLGEIGPTVDGGKTFDEIWE